jgi:hypothetical protein
MQKTVQEIVVRNSGIFQQSVRLQLMPGFFAKRLVIPVEAVGTQLV